MRLISFLIALTTASWVFATTATADNLTAIINKSEQTLTVYQNGQITHEWLVSTGKKNSWTPTGKFSVQSMKVSHFSSLYNNAPMPHAIFFNGNIATHGTTEVDGLGTMASKGCIRLHPDNAKILFDLVLQVGASHTTIIVQD